MPTEGGCVEGRDDPTTAGPFYITCGRRHSDAAASEFLREECDFVERFPEPRGEDDPRTMACVWFVSDEDGRREERFRHCCDSLGDGCIAIYELKRARGLVLFGVAGVRRSRDCFSGSFPTWCQWSFPAGDETGVEFWLREQRYYSFITESTGGDGIVTSKDLTDGVWRWWETAAVAE